MLHARKTRIFDMRDKKAVSVELGKACWIHFSIRICDI